MRTNEWSEYSAQLSFCDCSAAGLAGVEGFLVELEPFALQQIGTRSLKQHQKIIRVGPSYLFCIVTSRVHCWEPEGAKSLQGTARSRSWPRLPHEQTALAYLQSVSVVPKNSMPGARTEENHPAFNWVGQRRTSKQRGLPSLGSGCESFHPASTNN